jgi:tetratricopeptide (TPR) repeat protein/capsular polysaccharide biosynthesis protein
LKLHLPELHYNLGHVLYQQRDLEQSAVAYQRAIQLNPAFAQAHHSLAVVLAEQGHDEAALAHYKQVIALEPTAKVYNNIGCLLTRRGDTEQALEFYRQAIRLSPTWAVLHSNFGKAIEAEDPVSAIAAYRRALDLQPDLVPAYENLGQVLQQQGRYAEAAECYQQLLGFDVGNVTAHTGCGFAYMALAQWSQAFFHLQQALRPQQAYITLFCDWAERLSGQDQLTLARQSCSRFLRLLLTSAEDEVSPESELTAAFAEVYLHLGQALMHCGGANQYRQAEHYFQQALRLQPQQLELQLELAECLHRQQRQNAALMVCHTALALHPTSTAVHQKLGQLLEQQQRWSKAIAYYRRALHYQTHCSDRQGDRQSAEQSDRQADTQISQVLSPRYPSVDVISTTHKCSELVSSQSNTLESTLVKGIYPSTLDWVKTQSYRYSSLKPDANHQLQSHQALSSSGRLCQDSIPMAVVSTASAEKNSVDCSGLNCQRCLKQIVDQFALRYLGQELYVCRTGQTPEPPPYFVVEIPQGQAWLTPYESAWMVTNSIAVLTPDHHLLADVSREYPGQLPGCCQLPTFERAIHSSASMPEQIKGRVAVLSGLSGHNYFHWMVDILPRFELLQRSGMALSQIDWFWINQPLAPFQQQTLERLGIPPEKILASDCHPHIQAEQLVVPSFPGYLGWLEPWALTFLRDQFLPLAAPNLAHERIYISRASAHHRRVLNEAEIMDCLRPLGFVSVELESLPLAEQIALFANAKVIIAPHGGGLTNMIFCTPGTTIIELFAPAYVRHYYWVISQHLGLHHYLIKGEQPGCSLIHSLMYPSPLMEDIWINGDAVRIALARLGLNA